MKQVCFLCKGKGYRLKIDWSLAIISFGWTILLDLATADRNKCKLCRGNEYVDI